MPTYNYSCDRIDVKTYSETLFPDNENANISE